ncbi:MAG: protein kinase [Myxococcales bacterium]|nr:protein kinase [Myxococcales bacterium]
MSGQPDWSNGRMPACPQCEYPVPDEAMFCPACGFSMQHDEEEVSLVGRVLNQKYRLVEDLAEGGMAVVYKAQHIFLEDLCAVKIIKKSLASKEEMLKRFQREARLTRQVARRSPYVISIYDFGVEDQVGFFYVMELLNGYPFADLLQDPDKPPAIEKTARLVCQICEALGVVHEEGLVHRDIKPDNIFLHRDNNSDEEMVKLLDFGIARPTYNKATMLTNYGRVMGTPEYMSPEQCRGPTPQQYERGESHLDGRSDIYSLGVLLYQCLTGDVPFPMPPDGGTMAIHKVMAGHVMERPMPPVEKRPGLKIPKDISDVTVKALEKEPSARFQTMTEFRDAILACFPDLAVRLGEEAPAVQESQLNTIELGETSSADSTDHMQAAAQGSLGPAAESNNYLYDLNEQQTAMDVQLPPEMKEAARQWALNVGQGPNAQGGVMIQEAPASSPYASSPGYANANGNSWQGDQPVDTFADEGGSNETDVDLSKTIASPMEPDVMADLRKRAQAAMQRSGGSNQSSQGKGKVVLGVVLGLISLVGIAAAIYFFVLK